MKYDGIWENDWNMSIIGDMEFCNTWKQMYRNLMCVRDKDKNQVEFIKRPIFPQNHMHQWN